MSTLPEPFRIAAIRQENERTRTLTLDRAVTARPGQFVMLWLPGIDEKPMSVVAGDPLTLTVGSFGAWSDAIARLEPGDPMHIRGPFGTSFEPRGTRLLLVARGHGAGPMLFLARECQAAGLATEVLLSVRTEEDVIYRDDWAHAGATLLVQTADSGRSLLDAIEERLTSETIDAVAAAGPEDMTSMVARIARDRSLDCQVSVERTMKCGGMGLCGACELNGVLLCREGPVLPAERALQLPDFGVAWRDASATRRLWTSPTR